MNTQTEDSLGILSEFSHRLLNEWLPTYCDDPKRNYSKEGFKRDSIKVAVQDARDFMRAIDTKTVTDIGGGKFRMPRSTTYEVIFWEGRKAITPRPITLWLEPIVTIAAIARLHLDYGWPKDCLGMQSRNWAFDLTAFKPEEFQNEYIAGEVKKSSTELDHFLEHLNKSCTEGGLVRCVASRARIYAHKKWEGLRDCKVPLFWALGPGGYSRLFEVSYSSGDDVTLNETGDEQLRFSTR